jgi:hypothetical protein
LRLGGLSAIYSGMSNPKGHDTVTKQTKADAAARRVRPLLVHSSSTDPTKRQAEVDGLDADFFEAAGNVRDALAYAFSMASDGETTEAFGAAVTWARRMVTLDSMLQMYEHPSNGGYGDFAIDPALQQHIAAFARKRQRKASAA